MNKRLHKEVSYFIQLYWKISLNNNKCLEL